MSLMGKDFPSAAAGEKSTDKQSYTKEEKMRENLLRQIWCERNPSHDINVDTGQDMFWQTLLCVIDDFNVKEKLQRKEVQD